MIWSVVVRASTDCYRQSDRAGVDLPEEEYSREEKERADTRAVLLEINKLAAQYYYVQLMSSQGAIGMEYFKKRKLSDETIRAFGLGYSNKYSDDLYRYLKSKGYKDDMIAKAGLISVDKDGTLMDGRVGMALSHGCVRLEIQNAKWIYDTIPSGSTVVVYH